MTRAQVYVFLASSAFVLVPILAAAALSVTR